MYHFKFNYKHCASLLLLLFVSMGIVVPPQLEAGDTKEKAVAKLEAQKENIKKDNKKPTEKPGTKHGHEQKPPEVKKAPSKPLPPPPPPVTPNKKKYAGPRGYQMMTNGQEVNFRTMGVINMHGHRYTYYSSKVLYHHRTPEWYACDDHIYRTKEGYVVVASRDYPMGAIVPTPFGKGKVMDYCYVSGTIDIYVNF